MPQLRHAETSALIAEARNPLDLVAIAREVGLERVIFDDVGAFDLDAGLAALEQLDTPTNIDQVATSVAGLLDAASADPEPVTVELIRPPADPPAAG